MRWYPPKPIVTQTDGQIAAALLARDGRRGHSLAKAGSTGTLLVRGTACPVGGSEGQQAGQRAEDLLAHDAHVVGAVGENGERIEEHGNGE